MAFLKLSLLGPLQIELDQKAIELPRRKVLALLVFVVCHRQLHRRDSLAALFWPESSQRAARAALRRELYTLTTTLGSDSFIIDREHIGIEPRVTIETDVDDFRELLALSRRQMQPSGEPSPASITSLKKAIELYTNDFLHGFSLPDCPEFDTWCRFEAEGLRHDCAEALITLVEWHQREAAYAHAIACARRWLALDAMHEPAHQALMRLYALNGQPAAATRQYEECRRVLHEDLDIAPTTETTALYDAIRRRQYPSPTELGVNRQERPSEPQISSPQTAQGQRDTGIGAQVVENTPTLLSGDEGAQMRHNLPEQMTSFIGRQQEVTAIIELLAGQSECRLLTVLGPGGIGKTRLALQVAHTLLNDASPAKWEAIYFAPLAGVTDLSDLMRALADALSFQFRGSDEPELQLASYLRAQKVLLVVDNFEHLLPGAERMSTLLQSAPGLTLLITSREALDLPEEWLYPLGGLSLPEPTATVADLANNSAAQLFVARAQRVVRGFALSDQNAAPIVEVCRLVDGMPLGLELAAAWVTTLTVEEIAAEIASNIDILASEMRNIPARHRSLRAVFEQTWSRLSSRERLALRQLAVFRGGFTRHAAQTVVNAAITDIAALVEKSLIRHEHGRYDLHELLRQFSFERLDDDERRAAQSGHSRYFGEQLATYATQIMRTDEHLMLQSLRAEIDNVQAAWRWLTQHIPAIDTLEERNDLLQQLQQYVSVLAVYFDRNGLFHEGERTFAQALQTLGYLHSSTEPTLSLLLQLQIEHALLRMSLGQYATVKTELLPWLSQLDAQAKPLPRANVLTCLGRAALRLGEFDAATAYLEEALLLYEQTDAREERADALIHMGIAQRRTQNRAASRVYYQQAIDIYTDVGYAIGIARCLNNMGSTYSAENEMTEAIELYEKAHAIAEENQDRRWMGITLSNMGSCYQTLGNYSASKRYYEEALHLFRIVDEKRWVMVSLAELSDTLIALDELATARHTLLESLTMGRAYQLTADLLFALSTTARLLKETAHYQQAVTITAHILDNKQWRGDARTRCEPLLETLATMLSPADFAAAQFRGRSTPFAKIVEEALTLLTQIDHRG